MSAPCGAAEAHAQHRYNVQRDSFGGPASYDECPGLPSSEVDDVAAVLDAFVDETRGDGGELRDGVIVLETIANVFVYAYPGSEGWWEARLEVTAPSGLEVWFTAPLLQGPVWYADSGTTMADVVSWLRTVTDCRADRDEQPQDCFDGICEHNHEEA